MRERDVGERCGHHTASVEGSVTSVYACRRVCLCQRRCCGCPLLQLPLAARGRRASRRETAESTRFRHTQYQVFMRMLTLVPRPPRFVERRCELRVTPTHHPLAITRPHATHGRPPAHSHDTHLSRRGHPHTHRSPTRLLNRCARRATRHRGGIVWSVR
jgi:hypothetical protein